MKQSTIALCVVGVAAAITGVVGWKMWCDRPQWDNEIANAVIVELTDDYNLAITTHPADRNKALFALDVAARKRRAAFEGTYGGFEEYAEWSIRYEAQVETLRKSIRKG